MAEKRKMLQSHSTIFLLCIDTSNSSINSAEKTISRKGRRIQNERLLTVVGVLGAFIDGSYYFIFNFFLYGFIFINRFLDVKKRISIKLIGDS